MIYRLRSILALILIRVANRLDNHWFYLMDRPVDTATWDLWDWKHDYDERQFLRVAEKLIEKTYTEMHDARMATIWITQTYERHEHNPIKNLIWIFRGVHRDWLDIDFEKENQKRNSGK